MRRENYLHYRNYLNKDDFSHEMLPLLIVLDEWHKNNNGDLGYDDYLNLFFADNRHNLDLYKQVFATLANKQELESTAKLLESFKHAKLAEEISVTAYEVAEGKKSVPALLEQMKQLQDTKVNEELPFVQDDIDYILDSAYHQPGLRWRLNCLNKSLGSLRTGDFGFIFARPETGKTAFVMSEETQMTEQLAEKGLGPCLHFNNEEQGNKIYLRAIQATLGATVEQIDSNRQRAWEKFQERTKGKFRLVDNAGLDKYAIENYCERYKPGLIVIDQLDKIHGFKADRQDLQLGELYIWARELAKSYCPVIGVCQADGTAEGQLYLSMAHVANSKTSKAAEADWIMGIGFKTESGYEYVRGLSICKNKLLGDADTRPELRHLKINVEIQPQVMRYKDIIEV
jgi:hypothetical protein